VCTMGADVSTVCVQWALMCPLPVYNGCWCVHCD